ncbi:hypothetical protein ACFQ3P_04555 [Paraburkholderia sabiae]|uniref:Uncharacterized protein n=1 Tax=Paraburkholderia sabiae TaxID=273251 RepID=A0ABU9QML8_9BURK|nr:hypothetical protein [Paraburkholderia sabiae]WJZ79136.1 hypothetical protein QEN71_34760 [Paraburkholderia sabiae]CAD6514403.1 hypothetical protein LMG24235_00911 [Paraburkholderia sabiae]
MFLSSEQNRLPAGAALAGTGAALWGIIEMWGGADVLILQFAATKRGLPRVAMVDLSSGAVTLEKLASDGHVVRGAAVLSAKPQHECGQWSLEPLSEIHLGATRAFDDKHPLVSFVHYTTIEGREFSMPIAIAEKHSRGKLIYGTKSVRSVKTARPLTADNVAGSP